MKVLTITLTVILSLALSQSVQAQNNQQRVVQNEQGQITEIAGVPVDPGMVQQILSEAGPNPTPQAIAAAATRMASTVSDPTPIVAAAMAAARSVGVPNNGLISIGQSVVAAHAATPTATSTTVGTSAAVVAAMLPPAQAGRAIAQIAATAAAVNPTIDRGQVTATANVALAQGVATAQQAAGPANQRTNQSDAGEGSQRGPNPSVMAANVPGGGASGGGSNQIFNAPTPTPTPLPPQPYGN